jgi:aminoglycoside phosphotransferase (APT) family kinase protein
LEDVTVISGGFSRLMLDVHWTGGHGVVRIEQDGMFATEGRREASVMRILRARGYPVPAILWEEPDPGVLGHPFFVMEYVEGRARTDDEGLDDVLRTLARLYGLGQAAVDEVAALDGIPAGCEPERAIEAQLRHWHDVYLSAVTYPIPLLERGFAWLRANLRATGPSVIVHGDPGPGNALADAAGVAAVIDWELAHVGDAAEDWAYLALIRGRRLGSPQQWKDRIAATTGVTYDERTWRAWEAFNSVKGACVNLTALDVFRRTARPTPDLLAIGVAVHLRFLARAVELTAAQ